MLGQINEAVQYLQMTIDLKPDESEAYSLYGQIFLSTAGDDMETIEIALWAFDNTIKYDSLSENIYTYRAEAKFRLGDKIGCCAELEKARAFNETQAEAPLPRDPIAIGCIAWL